MVACAGARVNKAQQPNSRLDFRPAAPTIFRSTEALGFAGNRQAIDGLAAVLEPSDSEGR
jgi:hypothetical protein